MPLTFNIASNRLAGHQAGQRVISIKKDVVCSIIEMSDWLRAFAAPALPASTIRLARLPGRLSMAPELRFAASGPEGIALGFFGLEPPAGRIQLMTGFTWVHGAPVPLFRGQYKHLCMYRRSSAVSFTLGVETLWSFGFWAADE